MSTRSDIIRENLDGSYEMIYCHSHGYPEHNGRILFTNYQHHAKVDQLIALGDISELGEEIGDKHDFDQRPKGHCTAYGRDRGDTNTQAKRRTLQELTRRSFQAYSYLFRVADGKWYWTRNAFPEWLTFCITSGESQSLAPVSWQEES